MYEWNYSTENELNEKVFPKVTSQRV